MGFLDNIPDNTPPPRPRPDVPSRVADSRDRPYALGALKRECDELASTASYRNDKLRDAAWKLMGFVNTGALTEDEYVDALLDAGRRASSLSDHPFPDNEIMATLNHTLSKGAAQGLTRTVPERATPTTPTPSPSTTTDRPRESHSGSMDNPWGDRPPLDAADWMFSSDDTAVALWGSSDEMLWVDGEALMICGLPGLGKSTLAGQLIRAQLGLQPSVLDLPVAPVDKPILYLGMDRPAQIRRSLRRQFSEDEREFLTGRLLVRPGPPIMDMAIDPTLLTRMAKAAGAGVVYVDSLKDAAVGLSGDEVGAMYNRARQALLASGVNICELHHMVKRNANGGAPAGIEDVYGSGWLVSGAGSVVVLSGEPGDLVVRMRHVKTPANEVGPWHLHLNPEVGAFTVQRCDLLKSARNAGPNGLTPEDAAKDLYETSRPTPGEKKKAERQLTKLAKLGKLTRMDGRHGPVWYPVEDRLEEPQ